MSSTDSDPFYNTADEAESAFYAAFKDCNLHAMEGVWASEGLICIHPGADALLGREAVMQSWASILTNAKPPKLHTRLVSRTVRDGLAVHVVEEHIAPGNGSPGAIVLATNVYHREENGWHLLEHHASVPRTSQVDTKSRGSRKRTLQ